MSTYTILQITEPDYGCEETHRAEPTALLKLREEPSDDVRYVEVPERVLAEQGLKEGKKVTFATDGTIRKYVRVVAAVIRDPKEHPGRVFATARWLAPEEFGDVDWLPADRVVVEKIRS